MYRVIKGWFDRYLSDPEAILLLVILVGGFLILKMFGNILTPIIVSIIIAVLLQFWVNFLERQNCSRRVSFWIVYSSFITLFLLALLVLLPMLWRQLVNLAADMPQLIQNIRTTWLAFIKTKHNFISEQYLETLFSSYATQYQDWGKKAITVSLATIPGVITWVVYVILVPLLVFFFLRDHEQILAWFKKFLPKKRGLIRKIWLEMRIQLGNYFRGKITEIAIVTVLTYFVFLFFGLNYRVLLACLVGLSVVIPFVGVVIATIPVVLIGYFQWGFAGGLTGHFALMIYAYSVVQLLDGSILVPLLFSEAVNLHPLAIIVAILFFGALWGFWGVFFAIPLATLVKALINAWPQHYHA